MLFCAKHTGGFTAEITTLLLTTLREGWRKWYRKIFFRHTDVNSYLLYVSHMKFRQSVLESLVHKRLTTSGRVHKSKRGWPSSHPSKERICKWWIIFYWKEKRYVALHLLPDRCPYYPCIFFLWTKHLNGKKNQPHFCLGTRHRRCIVTTWDNMWTFLSVRRHNVHVSYFFIILCYKHE